MDRIRAREAWFECKIDTSATRLDLDAVALRKSLTTLPVVDEFESACLGWQGAIVQLFSGVETGARQIGEIRPGDDIFFRHEYRDEASFVTVTRDGAFQALGWGSFPQDEDKCRLWAG